MSDYFKRVCEGMRGEGLCPAGATAHPSTLPLPAEIDRLRATLARAEQERREYRLAAEQYHKERDEARACLLEAVTIVCGLPTMRGERLRDVAARWARVAGMEA